MAKKLSELYAPKSKGEKDFVALHKVKKTTDKSPATKDDKLFTGSNIKAAARPGGGYKTGADEKAYDGGKATGVNVQRDVTTIAPYTVKEGEEDIIVELTDEDIDTMLDILDAVIGDEAINELSHDKMRRYVRKSAIDRDTNPKNATKRKAGIEVAVGKMKKLRGDT